MPGVLSMFISFIRTLLLYTALILVVRLMGKRQIGEMEPAEFVVTMLLANLAAVPMQDNAIPLLSGLVPILTVLGMELILAVLTMKSIPLRAFFCGKPSILIANGCIDQPALRSSRICLDELIEKLREKNVFDLNTVKYAILETDGQLSVMLNAKDAPASAKDAGIQATQTSLPYTIVSDGRLLSTNLALSGYDEKWLARQLEQHGCRRKDVFLLTVDAAGKTVFVRRSSK